MKSRTISFRVFFAVIVAVLSQAFAFSFSNLRVNNVIIEKQPKFSSRNPTFLKLSDQTLDYYANNQEQEQLQAKEINSVINTGILLAISIAIISKLTLIDHDIMRGWTAEEIAFRLPMDNWHSYNNFLTQQPILTKAITSATVYTIGDIISQRTEGQSIGEIDRMRVVRSLLAGLIGHGPLSHIWYNVSENLFDNVLHWTAWWSFFPKVVLDQSFWGPIWNNTYILLLGLMKRETLEKVFSDMKRTTIPLVLSGLKLWPLAHCVTYGLIPVENRLLWVDVVEIFWVVILAGQAAGTNVNVDEIDIEAEKKEKAQGY